MLILDLELFDGPSHFFIGVGPYMGCLSYRVQWVTAGEIVHCLYFVVRTSWYMLVTTLKQKYIKFVLLLTKPTTNLLLWVLDKPVIQVEGPWP